MPVSQIVKGEAAICVFTDRSKASGYKSNYNQISMGQVRSLEIVSMSPDEIRKLKLISDKLTLVAIDPSLNHGQFSVNEVKSIDEFVS